MNKFVFIIATVLVAGCSSTDNNGLNKDLFNQIDAGVKSRDKNISNYSEFDNSYLSITNSTKKSDFLELPMSFYSVSPMTVGEVLDVVESQFKVSYYLSDMLSLSDEDKDIIDEKRKVAFEGKLGDFFTYVGNLYGMHLEIDASNILNASLYQSKTYSLDQFIDNTKAKASLSVGGGDGAATGFSASSEHSVESDTWEKIEEYLENSIGEDGSATILEDFSIVKVKARPWVIKDIDQLFARLKAESQMQVSIQYRVISINKSKLDYVAANLGIDKTGDDFSITSELIDVISSNSVTSGVSFTKRSVSGRLEAIVRTIGQDVVSEGQFVGLPNRIMPINLTTTSSYISEIEKTDNENIDKSTTSIKTSELKTGLSMLILPKVLEDGRIQLTSGFTRKQLISLVRLDGVQLPTVDENETLSTVTLDSGDVELITLYRGNSENSQKAAQLFGAGYEDSKEDKVIAVLIGADSYKLDSIVSSK
ncbi:toxin co-regulated pilus biosynthesis outer membrane protein C [Vibrio sp. N418]|uniref:toxin co-regulated pilus biosynthesis outer membrane protein C n=1 Tax=Vibrio sp. (strain N418) TaxID=701176 RepID=UPI00021BDF23|nr:toxin co-regulated pilus biosynthesis outer membrane protein C [Vibrio sp. N418]EGU34487.1 toxin co-regulated pilus biosynthesis outer membrane protein C [Vibrio sp. N418]